MATEAYVCKKLRRVIEVFHLTIDSTEEELIRALKKAHTPSSEVIPGVTVTYANPRSKGIFPEWVMVPIDGQEDKWERGHRWGEGSNENFEWLLGALKEILCAQVGIARGSWDQVKKYGLKFMQDLETALKKTMCERGPGSPYFQSEYKEFEVAIRIGPDALLKIYQQIHWKSWAQVVEWMFKHPGYEELGPWYFIFQPDHNKGRWSEDDTEWIIETVEGAEPNDSCQEVVWLYQPLATRDELSRVMSILALHPQEVSFWKFFGWVTGHKSWKVVKNNYGDEHEVTDYAERLEYIKTVLETSSDPETLHKRVSWGTENGFLAHLRDVFFGWAFDQASREDFLHTAQELSFEKVWPAVSTQEAAYTNVYKEAVSTLATAVQKLSREVVLSYLPDPSVGYPQKWINKFGDLVKWYQPGDGDKFADFDAFERRARYDGWDAETKTAYSEAVSGLGEDLTWKYIMFLANPEVSYTQDYDRTAKRIGQAAQKLNVETLLHFLPPFGKPIAQNWLVKFGEYVEKYIPQPDDQFETYDEFVRRAIWDSLGEQVRGWYKTLADVIGDDKAWSYFMRSQEKDVSPHDALFFIPAFVEKVNAYSLRRIIDQVDNFQLFAQLVNAYAADGVIFDGWRQFVKHVNLQRYAVEIPGDDPVLKAAVQTMLEAPGVSVGSIRSSLRESRFVALARGDMDKNQLLQPVARYYYLTPCHELIRKALGSSGKAKDYHGLRIAIRRLEKQAFSQMQREYSIAKESAHDVLAPKEPDFTVLVPKEWHAKVSQLLKEHGVSVSVKSSHANAVRKAIGEQPLATDYKKLYWRLNQLAVETGLKNGIDSLLMRVPESLEEKVWEILKEHNVPMGPAYKAEILAKSDPRGWVCGDWAVCCMSFGSSKNEDYMYKRAFQYFIVSLVKGEDERMIAESVIDATIKAGRNVNPEKATIKDIDAWTLDNIEANKNYREQFGEIAKVYRRFWTSVTRKRVMVGAWHNDLVPEGAVHVTDSASVRNSWQPLETMEYSDFFGASECETWVLQEGE